MRIHRGYGCQMFPSGTSQQTYTIPAKVIWMLRCKSLVRKVKILSVLKRRPDTTVLGPPCEVRVKPFKGKIR
ncbi:hypothetical protein [Methanobacterium petrolearium]|uniref:hypothetical protein n=1 Tax=Methanobacterium petrolearium TaxID=710190 RepID=UPI001AE5F05D|nr:hypothetical protein [Methanobacterium petrolearium]MBP1945748.1 hypothetical protein [Methanobacterium petrolearium]